MPKSNRQNPAVKTVQDMFNDVIDVPYCTGTVPLAAPQSLLFYRCNDESRFIDFVNPTAAQLELLADACAPASFGRNKEDVLDENYRKAGKMDSADFATQFSPWDSGVFKTVIDTLLQANGSVANATYELYKLNVYGPGSFFKAHVDTPRSDTMFGSLVVVLPTPHTGGSLLFRHHSTEYAFNSAAAVSGSSIGAPHAAFAAFFSDVEHEVAEVTSGYRVTLTYNLYHTVRTGRTSVTTQNDARIRAALSSLLTAPNFLPDGGLLGFGLSYEYPFNYSSTELSDVETRLKGVDARLKQVCDVLGLETGLKAMYCDPDYPHGVYCFANKFVGLGNEEIEGSLLEHLCGCDQSAIIGYDILSGVSSFDAPVDDRRVFGLVWAKPLHNQNVFGEKYMPYYGSEEPLSYGNEATLACAYGKVCLIARIEPATERG